MRGGMSSTESGYDFAASVLGRPEPESVPTTKKRSERKEETHSVRKPVLPSRSDVSTNSTTKDSTEIDVNKVGKHGFVTLERVQEGGYYQFWIKQTDGSRKPSVRSCKINALGDKKLCKQALEGLVIELDVNGWKAAGTVRGKLLFVFPEAPTRKGTPANGPLTLSNGHQSASQNSSCPMQKLGTEPQKGRYGVLKAIRLGSIVRLHLYTQDTKGDWVRLVESGDIRLIRVDPTKGAVLAKKELAQFLAHLARLDWEPVEGAGLVESGYPSRFARRRGR